MLKVVLLIFCFSSFAYSQSLEQKLLSIPNNDSVHDHVVALSSVPHVVGFPQEYDTAVYVRDKLISYGFDSVEIQNWTMYYNLPLQRSLSITHPLSDVFNCSLEETGDFDPTSNNSNILPTWLGYTHDGDVEAELVYANYGRNEDYQYLTKVQNLDLKGKIVIVRYGKINRGTKVMEAQNVGAAGVIIYSDPMDDGYFIGDEYPKGAWRPSVGAQRGSIKYGVFCPGDADPVHVKFCNTTYDPLPTIPAIPISYADATPLLKSLTSSNTPVSSGWQGALPFHYHTGPGLTRVALNIKSNWTHVNGYNVIGEILAEGNQTTPVILFGNHRDAWTFGAADPVSGTAALLEVARAFGVLLSENWRPKRTIRFASWDGEEWGLVGSVKYGEANEDALKKDIAVYLNVDVAVSGKNPVLGIEGSASLRNITELVLSQIADPIRGGSLNQSAWDQDFSTLGYGSDYAVFIHHLGIASFDMSFQNDGPMYGQYHSKYDSTYWMENFGDPQFHYHVSTAQFYALMAYKFSTSTVLPFNYLDFHARLRQYSSTLSSMVKDKLDLGPLNTAISNFYTAAQLTQREIVDISLNSNPDVQIVKSLNERLMYTEGQFLNPNGIPGRPWYKHVLQGPGVHQGYGYTIFPGIVDAVDENNWERAQQQLNIVVERINIASTFLKSDSNPPSSTIPIILGTIVAVVFILALIGLSLYIYRVNKRKQYEGEDNGLMDDLN